MEYGVRNVSKSYSEHKILDRISIEFDPGKTTCILGPSGCGKTTLLNIITGVTGQDEGEVVGFSDKRISYVFQEDRLIEWMTVGQNLRFVLNANMMKKNNDSLIAEYLGAVRLEKYMDYYPNKLSGGMRQRVALIRAFLYPSEVLVMDEPFKAMDGETKETVMNCFLWLMEQQKRTVILVTHDVEEASRLGDQIVVLSDKPSRVTDIKYRMDE